MPYNYRLGIATVAMMFGAPEFMLLIIMSLMVIASVGSGSFWKAIIAAALGLFVSLIGLDPVLGTARLTFGILELSNGIGLIPLMIGMFAFSEMIQKMIDMKEDSVNATANMDKEQHKELNRLSFKEFKTNLITILRSTMIGTAIGALPGIGSGVSPWAGYSAAKRNSKNPEQYGKGSLEGLMAAQAATNSVCGANLIPLLTLGIPGDTTAALLMATLIAHGITPRPLIFDQNPQAVYAIFATLIISTGVYLILGWLACRSMSKVTMIKNSLLVPFVSIICIVGTYAYHKSFFDVIIMIVFGIIAYIMKRTDTNVPIFVIAYILGPMFETNLRTSLIIYDGDLLKIFLRPICLILASVILAFVIRNLVKFIRKNLHKKELGI